MYTKAYIKKQDNWHQNNINYKSNKVLNNYYNVIKKFRTYFLIIILY
jgi:hypothetical protein